MKGVKSTPPSEKTTIKKPSLIRVNTLHFKFFSKVWFTVTKFLLESNSVPKEY